MASRITYPLTFALNLSPVGCAFYEAEEGYLHVHTQEGWLVTGELYQRIVREECEDYEWCSWYLVSCRIPEDSGWRPEPLLLMPNEVQM